MNPKIFGLFVVMTFGQIGIYDSEGTMIFRHWNSFIRNGRADNSTQVSSGANNNFIDWFFQFFGQRPTTTTMSPPPAVTRPETCPPCKCGLTNTQRRIVGGVETKVNQYPWMAQLLLNGRYICGGSIINDRYILTASHCAYRYDAERFTVRIGDHDRSSTTEAITQDFKVERITTHRNYSNTKFDNDIALLKLRGVIQFKGSMRPVCLAEKGLTYSDKKGIVTGWGVTREGGTVSSKLLEVTLPIMSNKECRATRYSPERITDNMMCAGYLTGGKDSCQGDSGGPMHVVDEASKFHRIVGIVSWGESCALPNYPGVYTRVNRYLSWIDRHTQDACYCQ